MDNAREGPEVAGEGEGLLCKVVWPLEFSMLPVRAKAVRWVAGVYQVHQWELEYLCALAVWCKIRNRVEDGVGSDRAINWSGARSRWKYRMREAAGEALESGTTERYASGAGFKTRITAKGWHVLSEYNRRFAEIRDEIGERIRAGNQPKGL